MVSTLPGFYQRPNYHIQTWAARYHADFYQRPGNYIQTCAARYHADFYRRDQATTLNHGHYATRLLQETRLPHSAMSSTLPDFYKRPGYHIKPWADCFQTSTRDQATRYSDGHNATSPLPETWLLHSTMESMLPDFYLRSGHQIQPWAPLYQSSA
jgi:hypothetical protein